MMKNDDEEDWREERWRRRVRRYGGSVRNGECEKWDGGRFVGDGGSVTAQIEK
jgi:hypothetical protein